METNPTETPKPRKKRSKSTTPRTPRVVDPAIAAINETARLQRAEHRKSGVSARVLRVIIHKRLPQLTKGDQQILVDELSRRITPPLPMEEPK